MKTLFGLLVLLFVFVACNKNVEDGNFSYDLTENSCPTGKQSFGSMAEMCQGLMDNKRNNNCAFGLRCQKFKDDNCAAHVQDVGCGVINRPTDGSIGSDGGEG